MCSVFVLILFLQPIICNICNRSSSCKMAVLYTIATKPPNPINSFIGPWWVHFLWGEEMNSYSSAHRKLFHCKLKKMVISTKNVEDILDIWFHQISVNERWTAKSRFNLRKKISTTSIEPVTDWPQTDHNQVYV